MIRHMVDIEHASYILVQSILLILYDKKKFGQNFFTRDLKYIEHQTLERIWALVCREKQGIREFLML